MVPGDDREEDAEDDRDGHDQDHPLAGKATENPTPPQGGEGSREEQEVGDEIDLQEHESRG